AIALPLAIVLALALSGLSLLRDREDPHFGGGAGYRALLRALRQEAGPRDVMILGDDAQALFFLNENRARLRWYGLGRSPAEWDEMTRDLVARLSRRYARLWLAYDDARGPMPNPMR